MSAPAARWTPELPQVAEAVCGECYAVVGTLWRGSRTFRWLAEYHEHDGIRQERWPHRAVVPEPLRAWCRKCNAWQVVDVTHLLAVGRGEARGHKRRPHGVPTVRAHRMYAVADN